MKSRPFGELWLDCVQQARSKGFGFNTVVIDGLARKERGHTSDSRMSRLPTMNIPEPQNLGDFVKLFGEHEPTEVPPEYGEIIPWAKFIPWSYSDSTGLTQDDADS